MKKKLAAALASAVHVHSPRGKAVNCIFRDGFRLSLAVTGSMRMLGIQRSLPLTLAMLLLAPMHALAGPFTVQATVQAITAAGADTQDTGVLVNTRSTGLSGRSADAFAGATADASAAQGKLGAFAGVTSLSGSFGGGGATALAAFTDTLTLFSDIPGFNGPVTLAFSFAVGGFMNGCFICPAQGNVSSSFSVAGAGTFLNNQSSSTYGQVFLGGISNVSPIPLLQNIVLTTTIAEEIGLAGSLSVFAGADGVGSFGSANYAHTSNFYVDVLTPGVTFISASGATYSAAVSSVPEPSTSWLVLAGLLLPLSKVVRRQRIGAAC